MFPHNWFCNPDSGAQSIQSARLSLQSSELTPPAPSLASECYPPPPFDPKGDTLAIGKEGLGGANSDEGTDTLGL